MFVLPDTPRWYYAKDRIEDGDRILCNLFDAELDDIRVQEMRQAILASILLEQQEENGFRIKDLFWDTSALRIGRRIRISFLILAIQQMMGKVPLIVLGTYSHADLLTGINLSVYYSTVIFSQLGLSLFTAQLLAAIMNTLFAAGTIPLVFTIERVGRRAVLLWSAVALTVCMVVFVAMIGLPNPSPATQWTAVAAIFVYNTVFGYGWIGVCWLYGPEVGSSPRHPTSSVDTKKMRRLLRSSFVIPVPLPVRLESGYFLSSLSSLVESLYRTLAGRSGFGWLFLAPPLYPSSISCVQR